MKKTQIRKILFSIFIITTLVNLLIFNNTTVFASTPTPTTSSSAGMLTCGSDTADFDCVQIDASTVRWNVIGNPYINPNITGGFSVQNPGGLVYVTAHWNSALWVSIHHVQTNPIGEFGIVGSSGG